MKSLTRTISRHPKNPNLFYMELRNNPRLPGGSFVGCPDDEGKVTEVNVVTTLELRSLDCFLNTVYRLI